MASVQMPPSDAHVQRKWVQGPNNVAAKDDNTVTVVTYNILASIHIKPKGYPYCPTGFRETMERHPQLMKELRYHGNADVMCFQEVETEYFHQTLLPELRELGYDGVHHQKALGIVEGVATFFRTSRFTLEKHEAYHFKDLIAKSLRDEQLDTSVEEAVRQRAEYETPMLMTTFRCKRTGRPLTVINVHLVWQTQIVPDLNALQACIAMQKMKEFAPPSTASILCGDFNHTPSMPGYQAIKDGRLDNQSLQHLRQFPLPGLECRNKQEICLVDLVPEWFCHSCTDMKSSYACVQGKEPLFTTYMDPLSPSWVEAYQSQGKLDGHVREEESESSTSPRHFPPSVMDPALNASLAPPCNISTLDYIWFSSDTLQCLGVEEVVKRDVVLPFWACPNQVFPSDHLLMKAAFAYL